MTPSNWITLGIFAVGVVAMAVRAQVQIEALADMQTIIVDSVQKLGDRMAASPPCK